MSSHQCTAAVSANVRAQPTKRLLFPSFILPLQENGLGSSTSRIGIIDAVIMAPVSVESFDSSRPDGPYGQVLLFGDSITENAFDAESGFSYGAALSHG